MKTRSCVFMFLCFYVLMISCVPHELETSKKRDGSPPRQKTLIEEVEEGIKKSSPYKIFNSSVPIGHIWNNINYSSFDYEKFFYASCPGAPRQGDKNYLQCDYKDKEKTRKFSVSIAPSKIKIEIIEISFQNNLSSEKISALWEISDTADDFSITKYEKLKAAFGNEYNKITTKFLRQTKEIIASGSSALSLSGAFSFETNGIIFTNCRSLPNGQIKIHGWNEARVDFFGTKKCGGCAPVVIDGYYGKFAYCGPWALRDLFDYLHLYIQ